MSTPSHVPGAAHPLPDRRHPARKALYRLGVGIPALAVGLVVPATAAWAGHTSTVHVAVSGYDSATCGDRHHPCRTVTQGVDRAGSGGTVEVGPGVYHEQVVVPKELELEGRHAVIDATGLQSGTGDDLNAAAVLVAKSAGGTSVEGFTVRGAYGEGILVLGATHVRIAGNTVTGNDLGTPANTKYAECQTQGEVPGDCGEGLHLMSASWSKVEHNVVTDNSGGILVTDEFGPATGNWIVGNLSKDNAFDCGITLPSHNPDALRSTGARSRPRAASSGT